ncbi:MAG: DUF2147 domain-containing protein [Bacteroidota bacterium]
MLKISLIVLTLLTITSTVVAQQADEIIGKYHLPNDLDVEIYKNNNTYSGKIIGLNDYKDGQTKDINNPEKSKQDDPLIGMVIINNLEYNKEKKEWVNGKMYGPEKGMIFNLKITEVGEKDIEVVGSKYFFWHTMKWGKI